MTAFHYAAENDHVAAMEFALAHGADMNAKDGVRESAAAVGALAAVATRRCRRWSRRFPS